MRPQILSQSVEAALREGVKSIFFFAGMPPVGNGREMVALGDQVLDNHDVEELLRSTASSRQVSAFSHLRELDYSYSWEGERRFRVNAFRRMGSLGLVMRPVPGTAPRFETLGLPDTLKFFTREKDGLVLVTGPTGSGKSTTLAGLLDLVNRERSCHIVTIEDPVEFIHIPQRSIVSQREIGRDTRSFSEALRRLPREDPDVVLVGEIRDRESMKVSIEMAETGHLVFASLHTASAVQTVNRVLDFFTEGERAQMESQISTVLRGIVSQRLLVRRDGAGFVCACEVMTAGESVRNLIRRGKVHQIRSIFDISGKEGMVSMDDALLELYKNGLVDLEQVLGLASGGAAFEEKLASIPGERSSVIPGISREGEEVYEMSFNGVDLSCLDSSGEFQAADEGLLFIAPEGAPRDSHFLADYGILNGRRDPFVLGRAISVSYRIDEYLKNRTYGFSIRVVGQAKREGEVPVPLGLIADGTWHTLEITVPSRLRGMEVRYFMLLLDPRTPRIMFRTVRFLR